MLRSREFIRGRAFVVTMLALAGSALVGYLARSVPLAEPVLSREDATRNWPVVLSAALAVSGFGAIVAASARRRSPTDDVDSRHIAFAAFAALVFFQVMHMGEHMVQVLQLLVTSGDLDRSHGALGRLDFETVHFASDIGVWFSLGIFLVVFGGANRWLWIAFAATSLHSIEHLYLFWIYNAHPDLYHGGGFAGIMGSGGVIGSPLARPYLHFVYNALVTVPMVLAVWDHARARGMR